MESLRDYEIVFIVHPELDDQAFQGIVDRVTKWVTDPGGQIEKTDIWGRRHLAYPIKKQREGQYVLLQAQMAPSATAELERNMRLTEPILRFMITSTAKGK
jgi:small subunit ribosomal protein S6